MSLTLSATRLLRAIASTHEGGTVAVCIEDRDIVVESPTRDGLTMVAHLTADEADAVADLVLDGMTVRAAIERVEQDERDRVRQVLTANAERSERILDAEQERASLELIPLVGVAVGVALLVLFFVLN